MACGIRCEKMYVKLDSSLYKFKFLDNFYDIVIQDDKVSNFVLMFQDKVLFETHIDNVDAIKPELKKIDCVLDVVKQLPINIIYFQTVTSVPRVFIIFKDDEDVMDVVVNEDEEEFFPNRIYFSARKEDLTFVHRCRYCTNEGLKILNERAQLSQQLLRNAFVLNTFTDDDDHPLLASKKRANEYSEYMFRFFHPSTLLTMFENNSVNVNDDAVLVYIKLTHQVLIPGMLQKGDLLKFKELYLQIQIYIAQKSKMCLIPYYISMEYWLCLDDIKFFLQDSQLAYKVLNTSFSFYDSTIGQYRDIVDDASGRLIVHEKISALPGKLLLHHYHTLIGGTKRTFTYISKKIADAKQVAELKKKYMLVRVYSNNEYLDLIYDAEYEPYFRSQAGGFIHVHGRWRKIREIGRKQMVMYNKELILLSKAKKLELKLYNKSMH